MSDEILAEQAEYYRQRAAEYDATAYGDGVRAQSRIARIVADLDVTGRVLEIACGTGMWTGALAATADTVLATDAAPPTLDFARARVAATNVTYLVADVFEWTPDAAYDVIFFSAWLSHVPADRFAPFWDRLRGWLTEGGRVLFIDEHVDERSKEAYVEGRPEIVERTLGDGRTYRIVKNFVDPDELAPRLRELNWECVIRRDGADWIVGQARPLGPTAAHP